MKGKFSAMLKFTPQRCKLCGKSKQEHQSKTNACPLPNQRSDYREFSPRQSYRAPR